jgi:protein tyrosine/serine phosphatase
MNMIFVDHGIFRAIYLNKHRVGAKAWRAAQPLPYQFDAFARDGVRTVVSLRGGVLFGSYPLEIDACDRLGLRFERFVLRSRALPTVEELHRTRDFLAAIEYPVVFHCKSGADRAGIMSALYLIMVEGASPKDAAGQLSLRYGHLKTGPTGVLDLFMDQAIAAEARGVAFWDWVDREYDPVALRAGYKSSGWGKWLVNRLLRRE